MTTPPISTPSYCCNKCKCLFTILRAGSDFSTAAYCPCCSKSELLGAINPEPTFTGAGSGMHTGWKFAVQIANPYRGGGRD